MLGIFLAALCHDVDHPGHSNQFEINSKSELALMCALPAGRVAADAAPAVAGPRGSALSTLSEGTLRVLYRRKSDLPGGMQRAARAPARNSSRRGLTAQVQRRQCARESPRRRDVPHSLPARARHPVAAEQRPEADSAQDDREDDLVDRHVAALRAARED